MYLAVDEHDRVKLGCNRLLVGRRFATHAAQHVGDELGEARVGCRAREREREATARPQELGRRQHQRGEMRERQMHEHSSMVSVLPRATHSLMLFDLALISAAVASS